MGQNRNNGKGLTKQACTSLSLTVLVLSTTHGGALAALVVRAESEAWATAV